MAFQLSTEGKWQLYDELYAEGVEVFSRYNPCQIRPNPDKPGEILCRGGSGCCYGCQYLGPEGCTTNSLACKLWVCYEIKNDARDNPNLQRMTGELKALMNECHRAAIPTFARASKEENFGGYSRQPGGGRIGDIYGTAK